MRGRRGTIEAIDFRAAPENRHAIRAKCLCGAALLVILFGSLAAHLKQTAGGVRRLDIVDKTNIGPEGHSRTTLRVIIAINFLPLLSIAVVVSTFPFRRTGGALPGVL